MGQKFGQNQLWVGVERMARFGRWGESERPKAGKRYPAQRKTSRHCECRCADFRRGGKVVA